MRLCCLRPLCLCLCFLAACDRSNAPATTRVTGHVTLDAKPLDKGLIQFVAQDGRGPTAASEILAGNYAVDVPPGVKRVEVTAPVVVGKHKMYDTPDSPVHDLVEERIPLEYNVKSTLKLTVTHEAAKFDVDLKSAN